MKVYVLVENHRYTRTELFAVFSKPLSQEAAKQIGTRLSYYDEAEQELLCTYKCLEIEVDKYSAVPQPKEKECTHSGFCDSDIANCAIGIISSLANHQYNEETFKTLQQQARSVYIQWLKADHD